MSLLLRPPLALARLTESARGQVVFALPHPRADGATHLLLDPLELIEKLTLLIPPPRFPGCLRRPRRGGRRSFRSALMPSRKSPRRGAAGGAVGRGVGIAA